MLLPQQLGMNSIRSRKPYLRAFTMVEMIVSLGIIVVFLGVVMTTVVIATRCYHLVHDHDTLLRQGRLTKEAFAQEVEAADFVLDTGTNPAYLTLLMSVEEERTNIVSFAYDSIDRTLVKVSDETNVTVLLSDCEEVQFRLLQRSYETMSTNTLVLEPVELLPHTLTSCQSIELKWLCRKYRDEDRSQMNAEDRGQILVRMRN